jgi:hypothetical protein
MASGSDIIELDDRSAGKATTKSAMTPSDPESLAPSIVQPLYTYAPSSEIKSVSFTKRKGRYILADQNRLQNSLLAGVGYLELANAGDFAANVWNDIPVPHFAAALMAVGATFALTISMFAFYDARLSYRNVVLLRQERAHLQMQKVNSAQDKQVARDIETQLAVNFRETGTEMIDRVGMDIVMGFGSILVGVGTFLAIGGANPRLYKASNLLSGYIGNAPVALYGIANTLWSMYVIRRAQKHSIAGAGALDSKEEHLLHRRTRTVKTHAAINGMAGIIAGAGSLITSSMWWGYPILIPCIISSILCNYIWRHRIGYGRPLIQQAIRIDKDCLVRDLNRVMAAQQTLKDAPSNSLSTLVSDPESISSILDFIITNDLLEDFYISLLGDATLSRLILGPLSDDITVNTRSLLTANKELLPQIREIAQTTIREMGLIRLQYRERYLLETIGCYLCAPENKTSPEKLSMNV